MYVKLLENYGNKQLAVNGVLYYFYVAAISKLPLQIFKRSYKIKAFFFFSLNIWSLTEILHFFNCYRMFLQPQIPTAFSDC